MGHYSTSSIRLYICQFITGMLVILFCYAVASKLGDLKMFEWQMMNQALPRWLNHALIWTVPLSEIIIVILLVFKRTQLCGLIGSVILMSLFTLYVGAVVFHFFDRVPCSCGGVLKSMSWEIHLVFNVVVTLVAGVGVVLSPALTSSGLRPPSPKEKDRLPTGSD